MARSRFVETLSTKVERVLNKGLSKKFRVRPVFLLLFFMSDLIRLVYASKATFCDRHIGARHRVVDGIIRQAQANNRPGGVTGVLCFDNGCFFQALEGERGAVEALYDRILEDSRHEGVWLLWKRPVSQRLFDRWSMKYINVDAYIHRLLERERLQRFDPHQFSDPLIEELLESIKASEARPETPLQAPVRWLSQQEAQRGWRVSFFVAAAAGMLALLIGLSLAGLL